MGREDNSERSGDAGYDKLKFDLWDILALLCLFILISAVLIISVVEGDFEFEGTEVRRRLIDG